MVPEVAHASGPLNTVRRILTETPLTPAAHLTCVGASRADVDAVVRTYGDAGVKHIVALRGDPPDGQSDFQAHPRGYANATELVAGIRAIGDFEISVAAYPEVHPNGVSPQADLDNLKRKLDAGASRTITQFFFEPDMYLRFLDSARGANINAPIVPGILPVTNFSRLPGFAAKCGASVPHWLVERLGKLDDTPDIQQSVAIAVATELCTQLLDAGVHEFHFYTLNRAELTWAICQGLGLRPDTECTK